MSISTLSSIASTATSYLDEDNQMQNSETIYQSLIPNQYQLQSFLDKDSNVNSDRIKTFSKVQDQDCIVPSLPASSTLAAGFEKVERSLRLLQIKLNLLTKEEVENNDNDSNVSRIVTKALQLNNCEKHETKVEDLKDSSVFISSELSPKKTVENEVIKSTIDIKSKLKEIDVPVAEELIAEGPACDLVVNGAGHSHGDVVCVVSHLPRPRSGAGQGKLHRRSQTRAAVVRLG